MSRLPRRPALVVIGASAGGVEALLPLLAGVHAQSPPVLAVVHVPRSRPSLMAGIFARQCGVPVSEAFDKAPLRPGSIVFAPADYHLQVERDATLSLSVDEPVQYSRPSIDVLFESAASAFGNRVLAIVLTGANEDGANGAAAVARAGGEVLVQDPDTALADAMPRAALAAVSSARACSLAEIGRIVQQLVFEDPA